MLEIYTARYARQGFFFFFFGQKLDRFAIQFSVFSESSESYESYKLLTIKVFLDYQGKSRVREMGRKDFLKGFEGLAVIMGEI